MPPSGWGMPSRSTIAAKRVRSSVRSIASAPMPGRDTPAASRRAARLSGVWPPNWTSAGSGASPSRRLRGDDLEHALGVERLEVQARRGVEVGRDRLGVRVDHHRRHAAVAERRRRLDRAVVELDALADAHRPRADDERGRARRPAGPPAATRPPRTWRRSRASRPRTPRRTCRPSRSPGRSPMRVTARRDLAPRRGPSASRCRGR